MYEGTYRRKLNVTLEIFFFKLFRTVKGAVILKIVGLVEGRKYKIIDYDKKNFEQKVLSLCYSDNLADNMYNTDV